MTGPRIILVGAVESTRVALEALVDERCAPKLLITLPAEMSGMHSDFVDLGPFARKHEVPVLPVKDVNGGEVVDHVRRQDPDFLFVIGWSRLVGEALRRCAKKGVLGYHPAPLPKGRGRSALSWTILLGMRETAGSLFWIDEGIDSGAIAAQESFILSPRVNLPELYAQHMSALQIMLRRLLSELKAGRIPAIAQDDGEATFFARRRAEDGLIDWSRDAAFVDRLVRALTRPYPGAFTFYKGHRMTIWRGEPVEVPRWYAQPGQVFLVEGEALYVRCSNDTTYRIDQYEMAMAAGAEKTLFTGQPRLGIRNPG